MKKFLFLLVALLILTGSSASADGEKIPLFIVKVPLSDAVKAFNIESCPSYRNIDKPFTGDYYDTKELAFISLDPSDYNMTDSNANLVFRSIDSVEKTPSEGVVFFSVKFSYLVFQDGKLTKKEEFTTVGAGKTESEALDKCFKNATVHAADVAGVVSAHSGVFCISGIIPHEYILNCGKKDKVKKGDEFHVFSKRSGADIGRLFATDVQDDKTFAQSIHLKEKPLAGDTIEHRNTIGLGTAFYYDRIFGDNLNCFGFYEEYSRCLRAFRPIVGTEWINGLDESAWNIYAGLKTLWHLGYIDLSSIVFVGRGQVDGEFCYTGGSIKLLTEITPLDWLKFGIEGGYTKWIADHDDEFDDYGGFALGASLTLRY